MQFYIVIVTLQVTCVLYFEMERKSLKRRAQKAVTNDTLRADRRNRNLVAELQRNYQHLANNYSPVSKSYNCILCYINVMVGLRPVIGAPAHRLYTCIKDCEFKN